MPRAIFRLWRKQKSAGVRSPAKGPGIPRHIAIIMDGNGRWAVRRGLPRAAGHRAGVGALHRIVQACSDFGVSILTVYAFSTENWARPDEEVGFLLRLLEEVFEKEIGQLHAKGVRVRVLGRRQGLPASTLQHIERAETLTAGNGKLLLNIAFNYGGRAEIVDACRALCHLAVTGKITAADIDEGRFAAQLTTGGLPDPDLLIRTGGDMRVSNFLLWQIAYAEIHVTPVFWPNFTKEHLLQAIDEYQKRNRRFGKV